MAELVSLQEALAIIAALPERLAVESVLRSESAGRIAAAPVINPVDIPPHTAAGFDGFAVRARDIATASDAAPVLLPVAGGTRCGDAPVCGLPHTAWEVFAGAALPSPFDAVIRMDDVDVASRGDDGLPAWIRLTRQPARGDDVRQRGEDLPAGIVLADAGTVLRPAHLMAFATAGIDRVPVRVQQRVAVLSTGRELVDDARDELAPGQVRNCNAPWLVAMLQRHGALPRYLRTVLDDRDEFQRSLAWASTHRFPLAISSGATAAGREDFVGEALQGLGAQILFRGVAIKPGWPVLCARLPHGGFFLGLPGNPASCAACFRLFVLPLMRVLNGVAPEVPLTARLTDDVARDAQRTLLLKARLASEQGTLCAHVLPGQEAHRIAPLLDANAWLELPPGEGQLTAGSIVPARLMVDDWACPG